ncbi:hypothetical protein CV093_11310 [Oceanobacillus sp. 143]|nr:hypothetical protein CV093_11310 [Oceanobacillus sp. 143]
MKLSFSYFTIITAGLFSRKIASIRDLKINTIHDHLIEIALYETNFPLHHYVDNLEQQEILNAIKLTNSSKLKEIKRRVNDDISYFQIRLILALQNKQFK